MARILVACLVSLFTCECRAGYLRLLTTDEWLNSKITPSAGTFDLANLLIDARNEPFTYVSVYLPNVLHTEVLNFDMESIQRKYVDLTFELGFDHETAIQTLTFEFDTYNNYPEEFEPVGARAFLNFWPGVIEGTGPLAKFQTRSGTFEIYEAWSHTYLFGLPIGTTGAGSLWVNLRYTPEPTAIGLMSMGAVILRSIRSPLFRF